MARDISRVKLYSRSDTAAYLTRHAEGVGLRAYDAHPHMRVVYIGDSTWLVIRKEDLNTHVFCSLIPEFVRVRRVSIKDNVMMCSCKAYIRRQHPCVHMGAVFARHSLTFQPHHFHLRWWMIFAYFYNKGEEFVDSVLHERLAEALERSWGECYDSDGKYKGISISPAELLKLSSNAAEKEDDDFRIMNRILEYTNKHGHILRQSHAHHSCIAGDESFMADSNFSSNVDEDITMGGNTQGSVFFSERHEESNVWSMLSSAYEHAPQLTRNSILAVVNEKMYTLVKYIRSQEDLERADELLDGVIHQFVGFSLQNEDMFGYLGECSQKENRKLFRWEGRR